MFKLPPTREGAEAAANWVESLSKSRKPTQEEMLSLRALRLFSGLNFDDPLVWPSKLRNAINYRPGFSYRTVVNNNFLRIRSRLSQPAFPDINSVLSYGERAKEEIKGKKDPVEFANQSIDLLIAQSLVLEAITEDALMNLCSIRDIECSARKLRQRFNKTHCAAGGILRQVAI